MNARFDVEYATTHNIDIKHLRFELPRNNNKSNPA